MFLVFSRTNLMSLVKVTVRLIAVIVGSLLAVINLDDIIGYALSPGDYPIGAEDFGFSYSSGLNFILTRSIRFVVLAGGIVLVLIGCQVKQLAGLVIIAGVVLAHLILAHLMV